MKQFNLKIYTNKFIIINFIQSVVIFFSLWFAPPILQKIVGTIWILITIRAISVAGRYGKLVS